ncbi:MAG: carboxypeptidase-like regulatory domain-containing protein [Nannocystaceae bacterium]
MRWRLFALVLALLALGGAMSLLLLATPHRREHHPPSFAASLAAQVGAGPPRRALAGRVPSSGSAGGGEAIVHGQVIDRDRAPVGAGSIVVYCLDGERPGGLLPGPALALRGDGRFSGRGCPGRMCLMLEHPRLIHGDEWIVDPGEDVELVATARGEVTGVVRGPGGKPVVGARTRLIPLPGEDDPTAVPAFVGRATTTGIDGRFEFVRVERAPCDLCGEAGGRCDRGDHERLPSYRELRLIVRAVGFRVAEVGVDVQQGARLEITLVPGLEPIRVHLVDADARSYPRARVLARSVERDYESRRARLVAGVFRIQDTGAGVYDVRAIQDGVEIAQRSGVRAGERVDLVGSRAARGPDVSLWVWSPDGPPLVGAKVYGGPFRGVETDSQGRVRWPGAMPGTYEIRVAHPIYVLRRRIEVPEGSGTHAIEIHARSSETD